MTHHKLFPSKNRIKFRTLVDKKSTQHYTFQTHDYVDNAVYKFTSIIESAAWASQ